MAYDLDDNLVYKTDLLTAAAMAYDGHGRMIAIMYPDGSTAKATYDAWDTPTRIENFDSAGQSTGESTFVFLPGGQLQTVSTSVDATQHRDAQFTWDGGSRITGTSAAAANTPTRATQAQYDEGGRLLEASSGERTAGSVSTPYLKEQEPAVPSPEEASSRRPPRSEEHM